MKKFKKLIPALCMLLISAVLMGTSTYAWFSMNKTVTATGMQVTAKNDSIFLIVGSGKTTAAELQKTNATTVAASTTSKTSILPSAHKSIDNTTAAETLGNWYYQIAKAPTASDGDGNNVTLTKWDEYVVKYQFTVSLSKGSIEQGDLSANVVIKQNDTTAAKSYDAIRVLVTTAEGKAEFAKTADTENGVVAAGTSSTELGTSAVISNKGLSDSTEIVVNVYVYYYGENAAVYTNNVANLDGAEIDIYFTIAAKAA